MTGSSRVLRGNALALPLADNSVDLVVTSPPYFGLRSYQDGGEHYAGQIGDEPTPAEFVAALIAATREMVRVIKPTGSIWVNLGDKYVADNRGSGGDAKRGQAKWAPAGPAGYPGEGIIPRKSLMGIPWRYAIRCIDDLGLILRAEVIWSKPNGLPESVTDRTRRSHEQWFHFTLQPRYYSAVDEIREATGDYKSTRPLPLSQRGTVLVPGNTPRGMDGQSQTSMEANPLGKLPGSVWEIPTQPLIVPEHVAHAVCCGGRMRPGCEDGLDHYAAFPMEWPRRIIKGWSPAGVCTACGEGRQVITERARSTDDRPRESTEAEGRTRRLGATSGLRSSAHVGEYPSPTITGYACACPDTSAPSTPAVVLDPFGGTGTSALVAKVLGRDGISVDMSADYCRLAQWRTNDEGEIARAMQVKKPAKQAEGQVSMFDLFEDGAA